MILLTAYGGLFLAAFLAATVLPAQSEAVLAALVLSGDYPVWALLSVAGVGNVLGAVVNWCLGRGIERFKHKKWFPVNEKSLSKAQDHYSKYGRWTLLLSWVPIIGDPLTVVAGIMRERFWVFVTLVSIAKFGRYIVVIYLTMLYANS